MNAQSVRHKITDTPCSKNARTGPQGEGDGCSPLSASPSSWGPHLLGQSELNALSYSSNASLTFKMPKILDFLCPLLTYNKIRPSILRKKYAFCVARS